MIKSPPLHISRNTCKTPLISCSGQHPFSQFFAAKIICGLIKLTNIPPAKPAAGPPADVRLPRPRPSNGYKINQFGQFTCIALVRSIPPRENHLRSFHPARHKPVSIE